MIWAKRDKLTLASECLDEDLHCVLMSKWRWKG